MAPLYQSAIFRKLSGEKLRTICVSRIVLYWKFVGENRFPASYVTLRQKYECHYHRRRTRGHRDGLPIETRLEV